MSVVSPIVPRVGNAAIAPRRTDPLPYQPMPRALVVVPTYNEAENIPLLVAGLDRARRSGPHDFDVLVVDDGSPDGSAEIFRRLSVDHQWIHLLERERPLGLGSAYRTGFRWALEHGYDLVGEMDADLSHDPGALPQLLSTAIDEACLAVGSRYCRGGRSEGWPWSRRFVSWTANSFARSLLRLPIHDVTAGYRVYRAGAVEQILASGTECEGYGFQVEAVAVLHRAGHRIREVPITFQDRRYGRSKLSLRIAVEAARRCIELSVERAMSPSHRAAALGPEDRCGCAS